MATITDVQVFGIIIFLLLVILIKEVLIPTAFNCEFGSIRMENKRKGNFIITTTEDDFCWSQNFVLAFFQISAKTIHVQQDSPVLIHPLLLMETITDAQVLLTWSHCTYLRNAWRTSFSVLSGCAKCFH